ncbi:MAG: endolytic transglycosylase MltG [Syntrophobacteraceae bacterium]
MKRSTGKLKTAFFIVILLGAGLAITAFLVTFKFRLFAMLPGDAPRGASRMEIPSGTNAAAIAELLHVNGIVSDAGMFYLVARIRGLSHKLQSGEYDFLSPSTPDRILEQLIHGRVVLHRLTFPEGSTIKDIAVIIEQEGLASKEDIVRLAHDKEYIGSLNIGFPSLEGYLFPETYSFRKGEGGKAILKAMVQQFRNRFRPEWQKKSDELGLSVHEILILASMVEKEAAVDSERSVIAAVFFNRIQKNMPLESDPTAVYDLADFTGHITADHLRRRSPYNTYVVRGLPVGPICNPGAKSIEAVLYPAANTPYLYFVSNNDGTHQFSETFPEHRRAVLHNRELHNSAQEKTGSNATDSLTGSESSHPGTGIPDPGEKDSM